MQSILQRFYGYIFPFHCPFIVATPVHPEYIYKVPRPPPDLPLEIWLEIFQFATYVHHSATIKPMDPFTPKRTTTNAMGANNPSLAMRTKLALVLVSRAWRRVAVRMLYEQIVIRSPARANAILQVLESSQSDSSDPHRLRTVGYGQWTRHIEIYTYTRGSGDIRYLQTIFKIFCCCPNLQMLSGRWLHPLPVEFLNGISGLLGPSLVGLYWNEQKNTLDHNTLTTPEFLGSFRSLRVLDLRDFVGADPLLRLQDAPRPTLPRVKDLVLSTHPRSLQTATTLCLPSLSNLTLRTPAWDTENEELLKTFLKFHGPSLVSVDLTPPSTDSDPDPNNATFSRRNVAQINPDFFLAPDVCPNLEAITFSTTSPKLSGHVHPNLRRIGIRGVTADCLYPDKPSFVKAHLMAINMEKYPRLELIQTVGFLVEAHADSIIKDVCIWWVERFERMGITFIDGEGVLWEYTDPEPEEAVVARIKDVASSSETSGATRPSNEKLLQLEKVMNKKAKVVTNSTNDQTPMGFNNQPHISHINNTRDVHP